jgi:DNA-binding transcriptional ArsR family regulator
MSSYIRRGRGAGGIKPDAGNSNGSFTGRILLYQSDPGGGMDRLAGRLVRTLRGDSDDAAVVGLDDETADQVFDALGSETTRAVLAACYESPRTPAELADVTDTSLQNVAYHVEKLESADLLEPVETRYGRNGREAIAYGATREATVVVAGERSSSRRLEGAIRRLFAPVVLLALASGVVGLWMRGVDPVVGAMAGPVPSEEAQAAIVPAFLFFLGGVLALLLGDRLGLLRRRSTRRDGRAAVLYGRDTDRTRRQVFAALAVTLATPLVLADPAGGGLRILLSLTGSSLLALLTIPMAGAVLAAAGAARNGGLLPCWALGSAPVAGVALFVTLGLRSVVLLVVVTPLAVAVYGLPAATTGYLLGLGANDDPGVRPARRVTAVLAASVVLIVAFLAALQLRWIVL